MSRICKYYASGYCGHGNTCKFRHSDGYDRNYEYSHRDDYNQNYNNYSNNDYHDYHQYRPADPGKFRYVNHETPVNQNRYSRGNSYESTHHTEQSVHQHGRRVGSPSYHVPTIHTTDNQPKQEPIQSIINQIQEAATFYPQMSWPITSLTVESFRVPGLADLSPEEVRHFNYSLLRSKGNLSSLHNLLNRVVENHGDIYKRLAQMDRKTVSDLIGEIKLQQRNVDSNKDRSDESAQLVSILTRMIELQPTRLVKEATPKFTGDRNVVQPPSPVLGHSVTRANNISFNFARATKPASSITSPTTRLKTITTSNPSSSQATISPYTLLKELSDEEKCAFSATQFIFGRIPCRPPPREYC